MKLPNDPTIILSRGDVLGDSVITTTLIAPLKALFPSSKIIYMVRKDYIPLFENHPHIDGFIEDTLPYRMTFSDCSLIYPLIKAIRREKADLFIGLWETPRYAWISFLSGIKNRIGHAFNLTNRFLYTHTVSLDYLDYILHKVDYNSALLRPLGIDNGSNYPVDLYTHSDTDQSILQTFNLKKEGYVALHIDAGNPQRILPDPHFISIIRLILKYTSLDIVLFGRKQNRDSAQVIMTQINDSRLIDAVDRGTLSHIQSLIKQCLFLIGSDSGPVHIASGHQRPVIVYYVNRIQNALHWGPWKTEHTIIKTHHHCIDVCRPTVCTKPDCREVIDINVFKDAIIRYSQPKKKEASPIHSDDLPNLQRHYWLKTSVTIGLIGPKQHDLYDYLKSEGWSVYLWDGAFSLKQMKEWMATLNINLIIYADEYIPFYTQLKLEIIRRWVSNYMSFLPKIMACNTPFEIEHKLSLLLP